jgi:hypothetical protein
MQTINQVCWEILHPMDPVLIDIKRLYESTQKVEEQIPWEWIERSISRKAEWEPGRWSPHLIVSADGNERDISPISGFIYGGHLPGFGGYVSYIGVNPIQRKRGTGTMLYQHLFPLLTEDAQLNNEPLDFVLWESRKPDFEDPEHEWQLWSARMNLFSRVGGYWIEGIDFQSPNYIEEDGDAVELQLFLTPMEKGLSWFDSHRLKEIAGNLHQQIYRHDPDDPLYIDTFPPGRIPRLVSPSEADRKSNRLQRSLL